MEIYDLITNYLNDEKDAMIPLMTWFLNRVMEQEALEQSGAERYEMTDCRKDQRNGYRKRSLPSRYGELELEKPQLRQVPFETKVFDRYSRTEKANENVIVESYIQGVSTRKVENIVAELGVENISKSRVSRIAKELDEKVYEFINKPIEQKMKYLTWMPCISR